MMTNLGKTKEEIIYELTLSLNQGNVGCIYSSDGSADYRIKLAMAQYELLKNNGIIKEEERNHE